MTLNFDHNHKFNTRFSCLKAANDNTSTGLNAVEQQALATLVAWVAHEYRCPPQVIARAVQTHWQCRGTTNGATTDDRLMESIHFLLALHEAPHAACAAGIR